MSQESNPSFPPQTPQTLQARGEHGKATSALVLAVAVVAGAFIVSSKFSDFFDGFRSKPPTAEKTQFGTYKAQNEQLITSLGAITFGTGSIEVIGDGKVNVQCGRFSWCRNANVANIGVDGTAFYNKKKEPVKLNFEPCVSYGTADADSKLNNTTSGSTGSKNHTELKLKNDVDPVTGKIKNIDVDAGSIYPCHMRADVGDPLSSGRTVSTGFAPDQILRTLAYMGDNLTIDYARREACPDGIVNTTAAAGVVKSYVIGELIQRDPGTYSTVVSDPNNVRVSFRNPAERRAEMNTMFDDTKKRLAGINETLPEYGEQLKMEAPLFSDFTVSACQPAELGLKKAA